MSESQHRTLICSVLFLDIEGYSIRSVTEQLAIKQQFNALLEAALRHVATDDRIILDTGDGAAVGFLSDPEDSLFAAMNLRDAIAATAPTLRVRIGINLGPVRLLKDINGQANIIGDGINDAQRVMSFAEPGKILVSRSYYEVVSRLSDDYARLFVYDGTRTDKHVREHAVYAIGASTPEPPHDFSAKTAVAQPSRQNIPAPTPNSGEPPTAAPVPDAPRQGGRKWIAITAVAVLVLAGIGALWLWRGKAPKEVPAAGIPAVAPVSDMASVPVKAIAPVKSSSTIPAPVSASASGEGHKEGHKQDKPSSSVTRHAPLIAPATPEPVVSRANSNTRADATQPQVSEIQKSIDAQYNEMAAKECKTGILGVPCREIMKIKLCKDKWAEEPPQGQSLCKRIKSVQSD